MSHKDKPLSKEFIESQGRLSRVSRKERERIGSMGGKASKLHYDKKKLLRDLLLEALEMVDDETGNTNAVDMVMGQLQAAKQGSTKAAEFVRDTIGQKPADNVNMQVELPEFVDDLKQ